MKSLAALGDLTGRVALVTGGAGHVGRTIGEAFAECGATVVLLDRDESATATAAEALRQRGAADVDICVVDLEDGTAAAAVPDTLSSRLGRLDILVNNAAFVGTSELEGWAVPFAEQRASTWRRALEVNLTAPFVLTQAAAPLLAASGHGTVINIGSIYGMVAPELELYEGTTLGNPAAYAASKGGLLQLTRWLSAALAPRVRVNAITLGGIWRQQPEEFHQRYVKRTLLGRMAREEDVKGAAIFLASDLSAYVTGQNLVVDGGWTVR